MMSNTPNTSRAIGLRRLASCALILLLASLVSCVTPGGGDPIRVAAIGDSLTDGAYLPNKYKQSYPSRLQKSMGGDFEVRTYTVPGSAILVESKLPYLAKKESAYAARYQPDVALIMFGTNDSIDTDWTTQADFVSSMGKLVTKLRKKSRDIQIYLLTPPPVYSEGSWVDANRLASRGVAGSRAAAAALNAKLIDINQALAGQRQFIAEDGIHLNVLGSERVSEIVAQRLKSDMAALQEARNKRRAAFEAAANVAY